ncbi:MAG: type I DNA topoisomerase [Anaeromyxobacter sp.]
MPKAARTLVVVESPSKAKTLQRILGPSYAVRASYGHVRDLPAAGLGVDLAKGFLPMWVQVKGQGKVLSELKRAARDAEKVFLATDPDREGEAIAWHLSEEIGVPGGDARVRRALLHELTPEAVAEALAHPRDLDRRSHDAQLARRVLDRLVGFQVSELLWKKVRRGLSAGRVQSVAVRLVAEREAAIEAFRKETTYALEVKLEAPRGEEFLAIVTERDGKPFAPKDAGEAALLAEELRTQAFRVEAIERTERVRPAPPPFTTATLQQDAAERLGFSAKKTMTLAQHLYEGVDLGDEGLVGLVSYMRTDSVRVPAAAAEAARRHAVERFGDGAVPPAPNVFRSRPGSHEAHEAIRPTSVERTPEVVKPLLGGAGERDLQRLYALVWTRFVCAQMAPAVLEDATVVLSAGRFGLRAAGAAVRAKGWLALAGKDVPARVAGEPGEGVPALPPLPRFEVGDGLDLVEVEVAERVSAPPERYTEASLVREMEERGLGRPSTYAAVLETVQERHYVDRDGKHLVPTELGREVTRFLVERFPKLLDAAFTAGVEARLDDIEAGAAGYEAVLRELHRPFEAELAAAKEGARPEPSSTGVRCPRCSRPMVVKSGRTGEFLSCSGYPACRGTRSFRRGPQGEIQVEEEIVSDEKCPECGGTMAVKGGRTGRFLGCTRYPACRGTRALSIGVPCPKSCGGQVSERRSKQGRTFFGCTSYPACDFVSWDRPRDEPCPECGNAWIVEKLSRTGTPVVACPNKECGWQKPRG